MLGVRNVEHFITRKKLKHKTISSVFSLSVKYLSVKRPSENATCFLDFAIDVRYTKLITGKDDEQNEADYSNRSG